MKRAGEASPRKLWQRGVLASIAALSLVFLLTVTVFAGDVNISDQAGVLNQSQIRNVASSLRYSVSIYTVNNFSGSTNAFDLRAATHVTSSNIVISISTNLQHIFIGYGKGVPLSKSDTDSATNAFISSYKNNHDYTAATISSINSLQSTLSSSGSGSNSGQYPSSTSSNSGFNILGISGGCLVGLIILGLLLFFVLRRNRNRPQYVDPNYGQPYRPNSYPPNYGQPYPPNYPQQNQGVNPWVAGGLGAAAGGLVGYELGKEQGEREARERDGGNYGGNGGDFGGGSSGDFGGGSSGDFGGGSSGDFGGGSSGDF